LLKVGLKVFGLVITLPGKNVWN